MNKIVLAFDSFKGSVSACEISESLTEMIHRWWPQCEVCSFPIADGGEGTTQVIERCIPVRRFTCSVHGSLMEKVTASYIVTQDGQAVIEMASANGLPLLPQEKQNPMETTTIGTGELIADALDHGYRSFVIGLGGSATNDAGIGVMHALGVRFLDNKRRLLDPIGRNLGRIAYIDRTGIRPELTDSHFVLACDVKNPFFGEQGAAYVFAPQKGADVEQVSYLDDGLRKYAACLLRETGIDISVLPGAGAAGGMGGGLIPFLNAELKSGIDIILEMLAFDKVLNNADVVLTGEGKIDLQTGMGKALSGVIKYAHEANVPVVGFGGSVEETEKLNDLGFTALFSIQPSPITINEAMLKSTALRNLKQSVLQVLRLMNFSKT